MKMHPREINTVMRIQKRVADMVDPLDRLIDLQKAVERKTQEHSRAPMLDRYTYRPSEDLDRALYCLREAVQYLGRAGLGGDRQ